MPWRFGWKHEYWDGRAHLTPRQDHVHLEIGSRPMVAALPRPSLRSVRPEDERRLVQAFLEAFEDGVEFCDWPEKKVHEYAA